jgi:F0F1-type ATP synthase gamma subunit
MPSLNVLKKRIKSVKLTTKITDAMKLVAIGKNAKLKAKMKTMNTFYQNLYSIVHQIVNSLSEDKLNYVKKTDDKKL